MPNITAAEIERLRRLLSDIDKTTDTIRERSSESKALCDNRKRHADAMYAVLREVQERSD